MVLYEVPLSMYLLGFGMGDMLANFHMCGIMLVLRAVFNMLVSVMFTLFYSLLDLICGECAIISLYFMCCSVNGSVCFLCWTVFGNYVGSVYVGGDGGLSESGLCFP